jgi:C-terminal processing protease CtpA/Prc
MQSGKIILPKLRNIECLLFLTLFVAGCSYTKNLTVLSREQAICDLDYLVKNVKAIHPAPFARISEKEFDAYTQQIKTNLGDKTSRKDFSLSIAELLASIRDEHTRHNDFPDFVAYWRSGGKVFPLKLRYENGSMTVTSRAKNIKPQHLEKGDKLIAIDGIPVKSLLKQYRKCISAETKLQKNWILEGRLHYFLWLTDGERKSFDLTLMNSRGQKYTDVIPAVSTVSGQRESNLKCQERFTYDFYLDKEVCLFKAESFWRGFLKDYTRRLNDLISQMKENETSILVVDLRGNGGGHWKFTWELLGRTITKSVNAGGDIIKPKPNAWDGHLVLLCDRETASAAVYPVVIVKDCNVGIIAGEETGGRASYFGNITSIRLPNSGLRCQIATRYFMRPAGYDDGRGVLPDLPLDVTLKDSVLVEKIYNHIKMSQKMDSRLRGNDIKGNAG